MKDLTPPTTGYVRASYAREKHPDIPDLIDLRGEGFDVWLAQTLAIAWDRGWTAGVNAAGGFIEYGQMNATNPYRQA